MNEGEASGPERVSSAAAKWILDVAAQLDSADEEPTDVAELRSAALDAGISAEAFDRSLAQYRSASAPTDDTGTRPVARPRYVSLVGVGALGTTAAMALASVVLGMPPSDSAIAGAVFATVGSLSAVVGYLRLTTGRNLRGNAAEPDSDKAEPLALGPDTSQTEPRNRTGVPTDHVADRKRLTPLQAT